MNSKEYSSLKFQISASQTDASAAPVLSNVKGVPQADITGFLVSYRHTIPHDEGLLYVCVSVQVISFLAFPV